MITDTAMKVLLKKPMWIWAATVNGHQLVVYRSPIVKDDDLLFEPVKNLLKQPHRIVYAESREDENMWFGRGQLTVYNFE